LSIGTAYQREREAAVNDERPIGGVRTETGSFRAARTNAAFYSELLGTALRRIAYTVSARIDRNSDFGNFLTQSSGVSIQAARATRVRASFGTAFNAPAFSQIRPTLYTVGSPNLRPERSATWQAGVEQTIATGITVSGTLFRQRFREMIQYVSGVPPTFMGSYANLSAATANGSELEVAVDPSAWTNNLRGVQVRGSYSEVRPRVSSLAPGYSGDLNVGDALIRRATHSGNLSASLTQESWDINASATYVGRRPDVDFSQFPSPTVTLDAYTRLDAAGSAQLRFIQYGKWSATFRAENLANRKYLDVVGFQAPGRMVFAGLRWMSRGK
jgi:outer membrane cobalamin receptor